MCLSGLRRIPGQVGGRTHLIGQSQNSTASSRLGTVRQYGALAPRISINNSQHSLSCTSPCLISVSNTQINRYSDSSEEIPEALRQQYRDKARLMQDRMKFLFPRLIKE